jgi:hypothetical protein
MRVKRTLLFATLAMSLGAIPAATQTVEPGQAGTATPVIEIPTTAPQEPAVNLGVQAIRSAEDPSTAINAFANAQGATPGNMDIVDAYVRKMVELNLPEMAEAQAKDLIKHDASNSLGWAVVAYMHGKRGQTSEALLEISTAAQRMPAEPFIARTAGQLVAWYDVRADRAQISDSVHEAVATTRKQMEGREEFASAYKEASAMYRGQASGPEATQPTGQPAPGQEATVYPPARPGEVTVYPPASVPTETYSTYPQVYDSPPVYYYPSYYYPAYSSYPCYYGPGYYGGFYSGWGYSHRPYPCVVVPSSHRPWISNGSLRPTGGFVSAGSSNDGVGPVSGGTGGGGVTVSRPTVVPLRPGAAAVTSGTPLRPGTIQGRPAGSVGSKVVAPMPSGVAPASVKPAPSAAVKSAPAPVRPAPVR